MRLISGMVFICIIFFVGKMGSFHFVLVMIVFDHENSLSLKSVVVYFEFVKRRSFEYLF